MNANCDPEHIISTAINSISDYLNDLNSSEDEKDNDKAVKLAYWLRDYVRFLRFENVFVPEKCKKYKRGDIIKVHLGFNIGSEEGGLHYAVVVEKNNSIYSPTLTIVPLTSIKNDRENNIRPNEVNCGAAFYTALEEKIEATSKKLDKDIVNLDKAITLVEATDSSESANMLKNDLSRLINESLRFNKMKKEISKMKNGSIALTSQITTISKIRICDPKSKYDVLHGIKMPDEILDAIDDKIRQFYTSDKLFSEELLTK